MNPRDHALAVYEPAAGSSGPRRPCWPSSSWPAGTAPISGSTNRSSSGRPRPAAVSRWSPPKAVIRPTGWCWPQEPGPVIWCRSLPVGGRAADLLLGRARLCRRTGYERYADLPIYIESTDGNGEFYGFPMIDGPDGGLKLAFYRQNDGLTTTAETVDRTVHPHEREAVLARARQLFPHLTGRVSGPRPASTPRPPTTPSSSARCPKRPRWWSPSASPATASSSSR